MRNIFAFLFICLAATGCTTSSDQLTQIQLGMSKEQIQEQLGGPRAARGSIKNKYGQVIEVWEYRLAMPTDETAGTIVGKTFLTIFTLGAGAMEFKGERRNYWLYFHDGKLVQWGEAGDWRREADRIYEFRFDTGRTI